MSNLLIYTSKFSSRLDYIVNTLFHCLQINVSLTDDLESFKKSTSSKLNYSTELVEGVLQIIPHPILFDYSIKDYPIEVHKDSTFQFIFFKTITKTNALVFDILGAAFWLLSRYEEYLPHAGDKLRRFHYKNSLAWQSSFLNQPLVNNWVIALLNQLKKTYANFTYQLPDYKYTHTIDIDTAYRYKYKGFVRTMSGLLMDILQRKFENLKDRLDVIMGRKTDPFDVYSYLQTIHAHQSQSVIYFFLLGDYSLNDKNHSATNKSFQVLIKHISDYNETGLHPSFKSNFNLNQLKIESSRLTQVNHKAVINSRQHFSMLHFPATYQSLIAAGIEHDYSMGYNDCIGFRASYCYPYKWYNLEEEQTTSLLIHPFCFNEVAFGFSKTDNALHFIEQILPFIEQVKVLGGELIGVFHNDSFELYKQKNYQAFYQAIIQTCQKTS